MKLCTRFRSVPRVLHGPLICKYRIYVVTAQKATFDTRSVSTLHSILKHHVLPVRWAQASHPNETQGKLKILKWINEKLFQVKPGLSFFANVILICCVTLYSLPTRIELFLKRWAVFRCWYGLQHGGTTSVHCMPLLRTCPLIIKRLQSAWNSPSTPSQWAVPVWVSPSDRNTPPDGCISMVPREARAELYHKDAPGTRYRDTLRRVATRP
jgi:hypothetical protein